MPERRIPNLITQSRQAQHEATIAIVRAAAHGTVLRPPQRPLGRPWRKGGVR